MKQDTHACLKAYWAEMDAATASPRTEPVSPGPSLPHNRLGAKEGEGTALPFPHSENIRKTIYPSSLRAISCAARRPAPIARMTVAAPVTMSPPAKTLGMDVSPVSSLTTM